MAEFKVTIPDGMSGIYGIQLVGPSGEIARMSAELQEGVEYTIKPVGLTGYLRPKNLG